MPKPDDLLKSSKIADDAARKQVKWQKCKFCGAMISRNEMRCQRCEKPQMQSKSGKRA